MMRLFRYFVLCNVFSFIFININGQVIPDGGPMNTPDADNGVVDGVFVPQHVPLKKPMKYEDIREADYIWSKRVYRRIDLREKMNYPLKYPLDRIISTSNEWVKNTSRWSLWTIIRTYILQGEIVVYENEILEARGRYVGDQFIYPIKSKTGGDYYTDTIMRDAINRYLARDQKPITDSLGNLIAITNSLGLDSIGKNGNPVYPEIEKDWLDGGDILAYDLKEDWFFDKERSVLDVRIIGIAPVVNWTAGRGNPIMYIEGENGNAGFYNDEIKETAPLFWLYFPQLRPILARYFVYNEDNDAQWMSFDDFFWKRRFSSIIYKESNVFDRQVESYRYGIDALIESEAITEEIRTLEHDMWNF
jgi:gliding motility associated protien GldN